MAITATSLKHPKLQWDIQAAMMKAVEMSKATTCKIGWGLVTSTSGKTICHVRHGRNNGLSSLKFYDINMREITSTILKALRSN